MIRATALLVGLLALGACTQRAPDSAPAEVTRPVERAVPQPAARPAPAAAPTPSAKSAQLRTYYTRLQNDLLAQGLLRGDGGGPDTPYTDTMLASNFIQVALYDEYVADGDGLRAQATPSRLRRWDQPIRMSVEFGPSVPAGQAARDRTGVASYAGRLARATGHPIRVTDEDPNFHVLFLSEDDRADYGDRLRQIVPGIGPGSLRAIQNLPREQLCIVIAFSENGSSSYAKAVAVIRAEHPDLLRTSCVHEELAQGLGLANDSPQARPSIFNDDEEFGLLTTHDEMLLKMLYDPRFTTGMSPAEARPIARQIAAELMGGGAS
ncbi:DUF2927 domain-containing protein [Salipiger sp. IMCC34102]|uniref:DUF2927 domain-containing protein n=1 Tax=Salipiger sp. IMCC34102 TaxID=2510647 RepID=UPI00101DB0B0|nr:DUF2927 domain-containing protein [Salipiger sp. IMCC34102]RYH01866.1 DUF2927 domain-containing protein [Salipiger sp. IMCC34102]